MNNTPVNRLSGEIVSIENDDSLRKCWIDLTIRLPYGHIVNINYIFYRQSILNNFLRALKIGMAVTVNVEGKVDFDNKLDYKGIGTIKINDYTLQLNEYIDDELKQRQGDYFSDTETVLIRELLDRAVIKIREDFDPDDDEMSKVEEHLRSLARKTKGLTKIDWKRIFISCLIDISIDLGFGSTIPEALYNLFRNIAKEVFRARLLDKPTGK